MELEEKLKAMLKQGSNSKKDIDQIVVDFFIANNALSSLYRYYDYYHWDGHWYDGIKI